MAESLCVTFTHYPVEEDEQVDPNGYQGMLCELRREGDSLHAHLAVGALYHWRLQARVSESVDKENYLQVALPDGYSHEAFTVIGSWPRRIELGSSATMLVVSGEERVGSCVLASSRELGWRIGYGLLAACKMALDDEPGCADKRYDGLVGEGALAEVELVARRGLLIQNGY